jgi:hypothetical protein
VPAPEFLDTNVLAYAYGRGDSRKQRIAQDLVRRALAGDILVSTQVLAEFAVTVLHKMDLPFTRPGRGHLRGQSPRWRQPVKLSLPGNPPPFSDRSLALAQWRIVWGASQDPEFGNECHRRSTNPANQFFARGCSKPSSIQI